MSVAWRIGGVPAHADQYHIDWKTHPFGIQHGHYSIFKRSSLPGGEDRLANATQPVNGMTISTSIAESAVNEVASSRSAEKRQMRWTNKRHIFWPGLRNGAQQRADHAHHG
jgi:hypothetical protein